VNCVAVTDEKFLQQMGKISPLAMNRKATAGRPTVDDPSLTHHRKVIADMLSCWWGEVGWQLPRATSREKLRAALDPLREHPDKYRIGRLLNVSADFADAEQIREQRQANGSAIRQMYSAQETQRVCEDLARQAQMALGQASPAQVEAVKVQVQKRQAEAEAAKRTYEQACAGLPGLTKKLDEMEAAYAQDELLMFIDARFISGKRKYARTPENLANAMAGLPFAYDVPFMGAWQSYVRCSKLYCAPHHRFRQFEAIQSIWKKSIQSKIPTAEFFYQEIAALPQTVVVKAVDPITNEEFATKAENPLRSGLEDFWSIWRLAIEKSLESTAEPDRVPFLICANFTVIQRDPKTSVLLVLEGADKTKN
jgi:hypothetical protein